MTPKDLSDDAVTNRALIERARNLEQDLAAALNQRDEVAQRLEQLSDQAQGYRSKIALLEAEVAKRYAYDRPCKRCGGTVGPDKTLRPMCYACGPRDMLPEEVADTERRYTGISSKASLCPVETARVAESESFEGISK